MIATAERLVERATEQTGLTDLGMDGWQEGLGQLLDAVPRDLGDDPEAIRRIEGIIVGRLVNRLRIEAWYAGDGTAMAHPIEGMLVIVGLPRSGTTALNYVLAQDPRFRYPRKWELLDPVPPPDLLTEANDPRRPAPSTVGDVRHVATVDGPAEDRRIHELSFRDDGGVLGVPSYMRWWRGADHSDAFPYHERVLRLLQSRRPPRWWLLKSPDYMFTLEAFAAQYPEARFVMTHRDPVSVVPSSCSVIRESTRLRLPDWEPDPEALGREVLEHLSTGVRRAAKARAVIGEHRFLDSGQGQLETDAVGTAERIYDFAGLAFDGDVRAAVDRWGVDNRPGSRGEHRYSLEEFGLTAEMVRREFADYLDSYAKYCD